MTQPTTSGEREAIARAVWNAVNGFWSVDATCDAILALLSPADGASGGDRGSSRAESAAHGSLPVLPEGQHPAGWRDFNVNNNVLVRITEDGMDILSRNHEAVFAGLPNFPFRERKVDADGWTKMQGWELMQEFGPHMKLGRPVPFDTTIRVWSGGPSDGAPMRQGNFPPDEHNPPTDRRQGE